MGGGPKRMNTPRTGLEDMVSQIFEGALGQAAAPRPVSPKAGGGGQPAGAPGPTTGMRSAGPGNMASLTGGSPWATVGPGTAISGPPIPGSPWATVGPEQQGAPRPQAGGPLTRDPTIQEIYESLSIPQYGGQLSAGYNPLQLQALATASQGMNNLPGFADLGRSVTSGLQGFSGADMAPESVISLLSNLPGTNALQKLAGGKGAVGQLLAQGGQGDKDFGGIMSALDAARRGSLEDSLRDTQERFSASGLRFSTDLANSLGEASKRSEEGFLGLGAQLLPELTRQRQGALLGAGQLQLGAGQGLQQGGLAAGDILGQLYQGQQGRALSALQSLPGAAELFATLPGRVATNAYQLGSTHRAQGQEDLSRQYQEFLRTQGGLLAPILNFAAGAPQITGPGKGQQLLGAVTQLGSAGLGAI